ncbi:MAG: D-aminoacylase, partial [Pseudomonadota bacterium]|nr:D-aminoacylase [Pseudomonadota bacterium]
IQDHATYVAPHQYSTGVSHVIVNGVLALGNGEPTEARPGRFVRGRAWTGRKDGGCRATAADWDWPQVR